MDLAGMAAGTLLAVETIFAAAGATSAALNCPSAAFVLTPWIAARAAEHGRIIAQWWNEGGANRVQRPDETGIVQIFKPEIHVLGDDGCALECGSGEADHHEADMVAGERLQKAEFTF